MIFDRMERLSLYRGLNANLDRLIDFALAADLNALPPGKNDVDGDNGWFSSNVAELADRGAPYERHLEYIDLQIPLEEGEIIRVRPVEDLSWPAPDRETLFSPDAPDGTALDLVPGTFAVFFPGDAHSCGLSKGGKARVRKLVGKARA